MLIPITARMTTTTAATTSPTFAADAIAADAGPTTTTSTTTAMTTTTKGTAGRTDYTSWDKRASELNRRLEDEDDADRKCASAALGIDGRHASSAAEAEERAKARDARKTRRVLDSYRRREEGVAEEVVGLLGPVVAHDDGDGDGVSNPVRSGTGGGKKKEIDDHGGGEVEVVRHVTRDMMRAGKRVLRISDTTGPGRIVLTQDLSNLESAAPSSSSSSSSAMRPKSYAEDAENDEKSPDDDDGSGGRPRIVHGIIKLILCNLHDCTVVIRCKIITGVVEVSHCTGVTIIAAGDDATVVTVQADLCDGLDLQFRDSPSGKNAPRPVRDTNSGPTTTMYWGEDGGDRVYHAGVSGLKVSTWRDGYVDVETAGDIIDYRTLGAVASGNAAPEEVQFVTSIVDGEFVTERVLSATETRGTKAGARPMTERDLKVLEEKRGKIHEALDGALGGSIRIEGGAPSAVVVGDARGDDADEAISGAGGGVASCDERTVTDDDDDDDDDDDVVVEEFYASKTREEIDAIIECVDEQKVRGNEAFAAGEYAQALLFYTIALDRTAELPDAISVNVGLGSSSSSSTTSLSSPPTKVEQLYPRHVVLSNRSACFLKLGHHEKALKDGIDAEGLDPTYVKGIFRKGLALHAMGRYEEAIASLASAQKIEPKNKQIKQAIGFAEMRMTQEMRKRMQG